MNDKELLAVMSRDHNALIEVINATRKAINAETKSSADILELKIGEVIKHQEITNGRVGVLEKAEVVNSHFRVTMRYKLIGFTAIAVILAVVVHQFGLLEMIGLI